jgi:glycerol-3-phosphate dehydrogenase
MFVVPWLQGTLIGTTDTYYEGQLDQPRASSEDVRYLVDLTNEVFPAAKVGFDEIISVQAGLRPLIASDKLRSTSDISRSERIFDLCPGVIGIAGGKLTTYRRVASKVVDQTVKRLHRSGILRKRPKSPTRGLPLSSALGRPGAWGFESDLAGEAPLATAVHLYQTYGSWWEQVWEIAAADPQLAEPIEPGLPYVGAEVVNAVRNEMAMRLVDVLARRTHVVLFAKDQGRAAARRVVSIMASELGWSHAEIQAELAAFDAEVMQFDPGAVLGEGAVSAAGLRL